MKIKKSLGQNFLTDKNKINKIIESIPNLSESIIVEVGPGKGAITTELIKKAKKLVAIEIDSDMLEILEPFKKEGNFKLLNKDILDINWDDIITENERYQFVSNLPYYISTKIMFKVAMEPKFETMSVMLQKELVERIFAKPGNKTFGRLTVSINSLFELITKILVPRGSFSPSPNVDSGFIVLKRKNIDFNIEEYLKFIKACFGLKRKTLINSLKQYAPKTVEKVKEYMSENNILENIRAEQIKVETYIELYKYIYNITKR